MNIQKIRLISTITLAAVVLSACGAAAPAEPTQDPNAVFTQVAETVMVSMTQTAEAMPPTPPPAPTATTAPTLPPVPTTDLQTTQEVAPTQQAFGPTATIQKYGPSARWLSSNPADGSVFGSRQQFNLTICMLNDGGWDWNDGYSLRWIDGYQLTTSTTIYIDADKIIEPGEKWCFTIPCVAPENPGSYTTYWNMYGEGAEPRFLGDVYYPFKVQ